ncbi:uncharacterized protein MYCGRDRAFT_34129, partial [Zymoseptoria tritici IPO323]
WMTFLTDDATRRTWSLRLARPSDAPNAIKQLAKFLERKYKIKIRSWRGDSEFNKGPFKT